MNVIRDRRLVASPALGCLVLLLAGCEIRLPGKPRPPDRPKSPDQVLSFPTLYQTNCSGCHGPDGRFGAAPPLNDPLFRAIVPTKDLTKTIERGRSGTSMPAFLKANGGALTPAQVQVMVDGIKSESTWGPIPSPPQDVPPYEIPPVIGSVEQGAVVFARACANCHGVEGRGAGESKRNALNDRAFLALISDQAIRRIIITGRPDLQMPNYAQPTKRHDGFRPLTSQEIVDLGALFGFWRQGQSLDRK